MCIREIKISSKNDLFTHVIAINSTENKFPGRVHWKFWQAMKKSAPRNSNSTQAVPEYLSQVIDAAHLPPFLINQRTIVQMDRHWFLVQEGCCHLREPIPQDTGRCMEAFYKFQNDLRCSWHLVSRDNGFYQYLEWSHVKKISTLKWQKHTSEKQWRAGLSANCRSLVETVNHRYIPNPYLMKHTQRMWIYRCHPPESQVSLSHLIRLGKRRWIWCYTGRMEPKQYSIASKRTPTRPLA